MENPDITVTVTVTYTVIEPLSYVRFAPHNKN